MTEVFTDLYEKNNHLFSENFLSEKEREYYESIKIGMDAFGFTEAEVFKVLDSAGLGEQKPKVKRWYGLAFPRSKSKSTGLPLEGKSV